MKRRAKYNEAWVWSDPGQRGLPRNAKGQYGAYVGGNQFALAQGECHQLTGQWASIEALFAVIKLETGEWLADTDATSQRYSDRGAALAAAAQRVARKVTAGVIGDCVGGRWWPPMVPMGRAQAEAIIEWACAIAGIQPIPIPDRHAMAPSPPAPPPPPAQGRLL